MIFMYGHMEITHLGHSSFKIRGKSLTLVTDPFLPEMVGLKFPKVEADIVTISHNHEDHNQARLVGGNPRIFSGAGEYEVGGTKIVGIQTYHDNEKGAKFGKNTIYQIQMDGLILAHLGDLGGKLTTEQIETLNGVDIIFVPVGGTFSLDAHNASEVVAQFEAKIVIPMHYGLPGLKIDLSPVDKFLEEMGKEEVKPQPKLVVTKDKLPDELEVVVLA